ncbi:MAG: nucleoside hydrolase [Solirubrobacteraceae bacterium]
MIDRRTLLKGAGLMAAGGAVTTAATAPASAAVRREPAAHTHGSWGGGAFQDPKGARARVLDLNDASGDPDGLFATVHALLSTSTVVTGLVTTLNSDDPSSTPATDGVPIAREMLRLMGLSRSVPVYAGSNVKLTNRTTPQTSDGARALIAEATRTDTTLPLYVTVGGNLTDVASAYLMRPDIASKFTLVWIGGAPYPAGGREYNLSQDPTAAQVVFNDSPIPIWQVPSNAYAQNAVGVTELQLHVKPHGRIGAWLYAQLLNRLNNPPQGFPNLGEQYVLGDSPLVLLTALTNAYDPTGSGGVGSAQYDTMYAPLINPDGTYQARSSGRQIRVYKSVDSRLIFGDFFAKLRLNYG